MRRLIFLVPIVAFVGLAWLFYAGLQEGPPSALPSPLIGKPAPNFVLPPLDGESPGFTRADLANGHPTVINFWASWCAPCRVEHPQLRALGDRGVTLYGVAYKDTAEKARGFLNEMTNPFARIVADANGRAAIDWGVSGVPETFVIDGQGIVRLHYSGALTEQVIVDLILPALKAGPSGKS